MSFGRNSKVVSHYDFANCSNIEEIWLGLGMGSQSLMGRQPTLVESLHLKAGILGSSPKLTCSSYVTLTQSLALYEPE